MAWSSSWPGLAAASESDPEGVAAVIDVGNRLGQTPERSLAEPPIAHELSWVIERESSWNPAATNPDTKATGLIQFMPATAKSYGTTVDELRGMTRTQQATYVERFFKGKKFARVGEVYLCTFMPAFQHSSDDTVMAAPGTPEWRQNSGLRDGPVGDEVLPDGKVVHRNIGPITVAGVRKKGTPPAFAGKAPGGGKAPGKAPGRAPGGGPSPGVLTAGSGGLFLLLFLYAITQRRGR